MSELAPTQPLGDVLRTGIVSIVLVLIIALLCTFFFEPTFYTNWVGTAFIAATPTQIILGLLWHNQLPEQIGKMPQPFKGIAFTALTMAVGALVFWLILTIVGDGHISPMVIQYIIMTVVVMLWLVLILHCWPITVLSKNPLVIGIGTLILAYIIAFVLWSIFFDYSFLGKINHPHYDAEVDPKGLFDMWVAITFAVTTAALIIVHILFDFWPLDKLSFNTPQPIRGIISAIYLLALAYVIRYLFVNVFSFDQVDYMIRVPVCMIFGTFLVNNMMQFSLFPTLTQPLKGLVLMACAIIIAVVMYQLYAYAATIHDPTIGDGAQAGYGLQIWIATAMLGITFPTIFLVSGFFGFWPFKREAAN